MNIAPAGLPSPVALSNDLPPLPATHDPQRALRAIDKLIGIGPTDVFELTPLTAGMTNISWTFKVRKPSDQAETPVYVVRLPGPGTQALIDRKAEKEAYRALRRHGIADEVLALDKKGRRVTRFYPDARTVQEGNDSDLSDAMSVIRRLHQLDLPPKRRFDIDGMINYYEQLCLTVEPPSYPAMQQARRRVRELQGFRDALAVPEVFCHCDCTPDNVLILSDGSVRLIDWEYAGRADPIMDVAMYSIFAYFDRPRMDLALQLYLGREATAGEAARLYLYAGLSGFLWSLWAHYKGQKGQDLGSYGPDQYNYLAEYYPLLAAGLIQAALAQADQEISPTVATKDRLK
jgi:thiamine kinase-like enzyme